MKNRIILLASTLAALLSLTACGSLTKVSDEDKAAIEKAIVSDDFKLMINNVSSSKMPMIANQFSDVCYITFKHGEIDGTLPYFGEVTGMAPMNPSKSALTFEHTKANYKLTKSSKGEYKLNFEVKLESDTWKIDMSISPDGYVDINANGLNHSPINYRGSISL